MKKTTRKFIRKARERRKKVPRSDVHGRRQVAQWFRRDRRDYGRKKVRKFLGI